MRLRSRLGKMTDGTSRKGTVMAPAIVVPHPYGTSQAFASWLSTAVLRLIIVAAALIAFFPFFWLLATSLKLPQDVFRREPAWIFEPTLDNYRQVLFAPEIHFQTAFFNTLVITAASTVLSLLAGGLAAYSLARMRMRGKSLYSALVLWTRLLPPIALAIPLYIVLDRVDLLDTLAGLIIVNTAFNTPFVIWILRSFFAELPVELEEAALIDGCSRLGALVRIVLPLSGPGIVTAAALCAFWTWNDFLFAFIFARSEAVTLMLVASRFQEEAGVNWGQLAAASTLAILPVLLFTFAIQKHIVRGLISGSVKG